MVFIFHGVSGLDSKSLVDGFFRLKLFFALHRMVVTERPTDRPKDVYHEYEYACAKKWPMIVYKWPHSGLTSVCVRVVGNL